LLREKEKFFSTKLTTLGLFIIPFCFKANNQQYYMLTNSVKQINSYDVKRLKTLWNKVIIIIVLIISTYALVVFFSFIWRQTFQNSITQYMVLSSKQIVKLICSKIKCIWDLFISSSLKSASVIAKLNFINSNIHY